uniref:Armadillo repeat-containing protein 8 n=1 Tax=Octactis speculum TaxID=3111310 RepID=A0A7S2B4E4_9STRA
MFRTHISNKNAVSTGCLKIMAFLADPDALKPLVAAGTVQTLVIALKSYPEYEMVHSNALAVLHNLAASSEKMLCRTQMCDAGIIGVLQRDFARDDLEQNVDVLFNMLSLVRMISELPTMVKALGILCSDIIKLVTRFRGRERFQQIGWGCVFQMTKDCPENREKFMNLGACQELCLAMVSFMENRIVYDILLAVHGVSIQNGASQDALVDAGAFEAVVKIMGHFAEDLKMTTICTYVLNNTVPNNERNGEKLRVTGVCRAIVNSLPVMMSDSKSFPSSIHTVRTLWLSVDNRPGLIDAGVCLQFWRALESLSQNENISVYIVNMLMNFSVDTTAAHKIVKDVNWEVYFTNIKKFPRNIQLQEYGLSVIANILCKVNDEKVKEIFGGAGACEAAMLALLNHLDSPKVLESALKTTYILSRQSEPNCERFRALNVRSMVQEAVEKHREVKVIDDLGKACFSIL